MKIGTKPATLVSDKLIKFMKIGTKCGSLMGVVLMKIGTKRASLIGVILVKIGTKLAMLL